VHVFFLFSRFTHQASARLWLTTREVLHPFFSRGDGFFSSFTTEGAPPRLDNAETPKKVMASLSMVDISQTTGSGGNYGLWTLPSYSTSLGIMQGWFPPPRVDAPFIAAPPRRPILFFSSARILSIETASLFVSPLFPGRSPSPGCVLPYAGRLGVRRRNSFGVGSPLSPGAVFLRRRRLSLPGAVVRDGSGRTFTCAAEKFFRWRRRGDKSSLLC